MHHLRRQRETPLLKRTVICPSLLASIRQSALTKTYWLIHDAADKLARTLGDQLFPDDPVMDNDGLTEGQRQESRSQRRSWDRAHKEYMAAEEMLKKIASRRENRKCIPNGERRAQQQRCNARFAAKRTTARAESPSGLTVTLPSFSSYIVISRLISGKSYIPTTLL